MGSLVLLHLCLYLASYGESQDLNTLGKFEEVFAWKQLTYNIVGNILLQDTFNEPTARDRQKRNTSNVYFDESDKDERDWNIRPTPTQSPSTSDPNDEVGRFFVQYNNIPMGVERVGDRIFLTVPRRRYGVPATLNVIDLARYSGVRSPPLTPYPDVNQAKTLTSVYRTRADECGRLWMLDTGAIEIPNNTQQVQPPAVVVFDLNTDQQILRYPLKSSDIPSANTPPGLASISVLVRNGNCSDTYAYIPDLATYGVFVYSLRDNDSWRHTHNYFNFNPTAGNLRSAGQSFQWNDGVMSIALSAQNSDGCATAYFHAMVSMHEFSVSTCALENRQLDRSAFSVIGDRGANTQSTMHGVHDPTGVVFFAEMGRDAVSCWNVNRPLVASNIAILAQDEKLLSYPSDLHVTNDEVWVMANTLPRWIYSNLDTNDFNFFIYRVKAQDLIAGTVCARSSSPVSSSSSLSSYYRGTGR